MWLFIMFDLPTDTKKHKREAYIFRKNLEKDGFLMFQYSVYLRYCASLEAVLLHIKRVRSLIPDEGSVSILQITDKQYSNIINIQGAIEKKVKRVPLQLEIF
jgi:CRISPR-associated protein Cas2